MCVIDSKGWIHPYPSCISEDPWLQFPWGRFSSNGFLRGHKVLRKTLILLVPNWIEMVLQNNVKFIREKYNSFFANHIAKLKRRISFWSGLEVVAARVRVQ